MLIITNQNFTPYSKVGIREIAVYPDLFSGEISQIITPKIVSLFYDIRSPKLTWKLEDGESMYLACLMYGVQRITGQKYNFCTIDSNPSKKITNHSEITPVIVFGSSGQIKSKESVVNVEDGGMFVLKNESEQLSISGFKFIITFHSSLPINLEKVYLSTVDRTSLMTQIQYNLREVKKSHGEQCVNGPKKELLEHLNLKKLIGTGTFGNVHLACSPVPCGPDSYHFAVKLVTMSKTDFRFPFSTNSQAWHEAYILKEMINPIVEDGICPNLPLVAESYTCSDCEFVFTTQNRLGDINRQKKTSPCLILLLELATGDMSEWLDSGPSESELYGALFQIMAGVHAIQQYGQLQNNDVKASNILYYNVEPGGYWHYVILGQDFFIPNTGKLFILNDFGVSHSFSPNHRLVNTRSSKFSSLGQRSAILINNKFSPLNATIGHSDNKDIPLNVKEWGFVRDKEWISEAPNSFTTNSYISYSGSKIVDSEITFTAEQEKVLFDNGVPADSGNIEFYEHPSLIPPFELKIDTQDTIRIFTGGRRASQQGKHRRRKAVTSKMFDQLRKYLNFDHVYGRNMTTDPAKVLAGNFIVKFFINDHNFTKRLKGKEIATYKIS